MSTDQSSKPNSQSPSEGEKQEKKIRFEASSKYFTFSVYVIVTFTICLIIFKSLNNWRELKSYITSILSTLSPFLIAALIAYFINPMINMIDRLIFTRINMDHHEKLHKFLSLLIAYIIFIGFIVMVLAVVMPQIITSLMQLIRQLSTIYRSITNGVDSLATLFPDTDFDYIQSLIDDNLPTAIQTVQNYMSSIVPKIYDASISIISWVINIIMAFVISCYFMSDKVNLLRGFKRVVYSVFDETTSYKIIVTIKECNNIFSQYIIGKALDSLIIGFLCCILMSFLKLPYAVLISLIVGITNMIPYFGPFIGAVPGVIILLIVSPIKALIFLILIVALQQFDGTILGPRILGNSTGLQPIWIIFAITTGGAIGGWIGMFVGVPIVAVIIYLGNNFMDYLLYKKNIQADLSNVKIPDINNENVFVPKDYVSITTHKRRKKDKITEKPYADAHPGIVKDEPKK